MRSDRRSRAMLPLTAAPLRHCMFRRRRCPGVCCQRESLTSFRTVAGPVYFFMEVSAALKSSFNEQTSLNRRLKDDATALMTPPLQAKIIDLESLEDMPAGSSNHHPSQQGWHFSCERGCTRDDCGNAGPFSVER